MKVFEGVQSLDLRRGPLLLGLQLPVLARYATIFAMLVWALMFYVWSRVDVRDSARLLDADIAQLEQLHVENDRLALELAARKDLASLKASAGGLGLVAGVDVVEVGRP